MQGNEAGTGGPGRDTAGAGAFALSDADLSVIGFVPAGATAPDDALAAVSTAPAAPGAALAADAAAPAAALASGSGWGGGGGALGTGAAREQADAVPRGATAGATAGADDITDVTQTVQEQEAENARFVNSFLTLDSSVDSEL